MTSETTYDTGVAGPTNDGKGTNVTHPVAGSRVHVPSLGTMTDIDRQFGAVSVGAHNFNAEDVSPDPESFDSGSNTTFEEYEPTLVSV